MRAGVDVGVHAQAHGRAPAQRARFFVQAVEFAQALDVEAPHPGQQGLPHLGARLAHAGKDHASGLPPAASTRASSPPETMSKPQPACAKVCSTARLELAFIA